MFENARRVFLLVAALVIGSVLLLVLPDRPIKLGLDLAGGVRLVYRLDFEQAYKDGALDPNTSKDAVIEETIGIMRGRIDPEGVLNPTLRRLGSDSIEVALPASVQVTGPTARANTVAELAGAGDGLLTPIQIVSSNVDDVALFPSAGGVIEIGAEKIRYSNRVGDLLTVERRGEGGTAIAAHAAGSTVTLVSDDQIERLITELGDMRFYIEATQADFTAAAKDFTAAETRATDWLKRPENADVPISRYNSLSEEQGGPPTGFRWFSRRMEEGVAPTPREQRLMPVKVPPPEWNFTGSSLASVQKSADDLGFPAVSFQMVASAVAPFTEFTRTNIKKVMVIVLNDEIVSAATINGVLPGQAQIYGRFTDRQVDGMVSVLRSGSLRIKPILQQREDVGATVGSQYVDQGWIMGLSAVGLIMTFMIAYYRSLGVYASIALALNLLMQMAALVAFQATLTMPGIAGIILGIGMAVDANILIFDRIREEQENGKKPILAAKAGFDHAMSAIVDSNVTTLLSGFILYSVGSGPIRGFAVTLLIGVLTSLFAALVVVRLLVHRRLEKDPTTPFAMKRWLADANYDVVGKTKLALGISAVLMISGLTLFFVLEPKKKFGIDFLGGATVRVRTAQPMETEVLKNRVQSLAGDFSSAEVAALPGSRAGDGKFTQFRISFKADYKPGQSGDEAGSEATFKSEVAHKLADVLQKDQLEVSQVQSAETSAVQGTLYFEVGHPLDDVKTRLEAAQLKDVTLELAPQRTDVVTFKGQIRAGLTDLDLQSLIKSSFVGGIDSAGSPMRFAEAIPESSIIGVQVVGELRDSALRALLLSMFVTVIYIRVRFSEYSYGFAAVISLIHDLVFTVGAISFLIAFPWIHTEFDMSTIAVFLTIVGYSINDTIIVFDRIRENRPRMKGTLEQIVNTSINQTFSRTIMTSGTTVGAILVVMLFNLGTGNVLEGFAFAMTFGIATGTFSSIYIAAPVFIMLEKRAMRRAEAEAAAEGRREVSAS